MRRIRRKFDKVFGLNEKSMAKHGSKLGLELLESRLLLSGAGPNAVFGDLLNIDVGDGPVGVISEDFNSDGLADLAVGSATQKMWRWAIALNLLPLLILMETACWIWRRRIYTAMM